jgi:tetratricopeptide (TPR) repeat protein
LTEDKEDPVKLHKEGNTLHELEKFEKAKEKFLKASELYKKGNNFFDSAFMLYKAGECEYALQNHETALQRFLDSAELSFSKGFDRFGVSALEYARDCYKTLKKKKEVKSIEKKIKKVKAKLAQSF